MTDFDWGTTVVEEEVDGHPCLMWEPRRKAVHELLLDAGRFSAREFLVRGTRRISFGQHEQAVHRIAHRLSDAGVGPGDRVMILSGNHPATVAAWWGIATLGACSVLANGWWSPAEIEGALERVTPRLILADRRRAERISTGTPTLTIEALEEDFDPGPEVARFEAPAVNEGDPAVILFTSGTTGFPKGAILSHRAIIANLHNLLAMNRALPQQLPHDAPLSVSLMALPLFHISGLQTMLMNVLTGGCLVFRSDARFDAAEILELIERERITHLGAVPTMLGRIVDHPHVTKRDLTTVRGVTTGGSPVAPALTDRLRTTFPRAGRGVGAVYGLSEAGGVLTAIGGADYLARPWSSGRPMPVVTLRIDAPDDTGVGEVLARSPANMSGYWGLSDDRTVDEDGWLHSGDLGRLDDGELVLVGRAKDVIIRGGENVAAPHVEACLLEHPAVSEVAVVGLDHPDLGEEVAAAVVVLPDAGVTGDELAAWAAGRLAAFEVPTAWWIRDALPTNATGKVLKAAIRRDWAVRVPGSA